MPERKRERRCRLRRRRSGCERCALPRRRRSVRRAARERRRALRGREDRRGGVRCRGAARRARGRRGLRCARLRRHPRPRRRRRRLHGWNAGRGADGNRAHARHGTTTIFPTTTTGSPRPGRRDAGRVQFRAPRARMRARRRRPFLRAVLRGGQGRLPRCGRPPRPGARRVRALPRLGPRPDRNLRRRAARRRGLLRGRSRSRVPRHLRALERELGRDGARLRCRHAPRRSLLVRDELRSERRRAAGHADAGQHGAVRAPAGRDEHRGDRGRRASRAGAAGVRLPREGARAALPRHRLEPRARHASGASTASGRRPTARRSRATASSGGRERGWRARSSEWTGWCGRWSARRAPRFPRRCGWRA